MSADSWYFSAPFDYAHVHRLGKVDLQERFRRVEETMKRLSDGATGVRSGLSDTRYVKHLVVYLVSFLIKNMIRLLDEAEALDQLSRELHGRVSELVASLDGNFWLPCLRHIVFPSSSRSCSKRRCTSTG